MNPLCISGPSCYCQRASAVPISWVDVNGTEIEGFCSTSEASRRLNIPYTFIVAAVKKAMPTQEGYIFKRRNPKAKEARLKRPPTAPMPEMVMGRKSVSYVYKRKSKRTVDLESMLQKAGCPEFLHKLSMERYSCKIIRDAMASEMDRRWLIGSLGEIGISVGQVRNITDALRCTSSAGKFS